MDSRRIIILLSCALGIALLALGFLLGRESNRAPAPIVVAAPLTAPAVGATAAELVEPTAAPTAAAPPATA
ncbi:MAG: hypothetical protein JWN44_5121, partial [Myxococcales bacterium]|nr:hypothetical protein [Myxococcales bacterium]